MKNRLSVYVVPVVLGTYNRVARKTDAVEDQ